MMQLIKEFGNKFVYLDKCWLNILENVHFCLHNQCVCCTCFKHQIKLYIHPAMRRYQDPMERIWKNRPKKYTKTLIASNGTVFIVSPFHAWIVGKPWEAPYKLPKNTTCTDTHRTCDYHQYRVNKSCKTPCRLAIFLNPAAMLASMWKSGVREQ